MRQIPHLLMFIIIIIILLLLTELRCIGHGIVGGLAAPIDCGRKNDREGEGVGKAEAWCIAM
jgi:hypothetical protein